MRAEISEGGGAECTQITHLHSLAIYHPQTRYLKAFSQSGRFPPPPSKKNTDKIWVGSRATLFRTPPGPAIQLATKPAFHLVIKSSLNPTEIPLNLTDNPPNLTEGARNQTERIAVSNAALIANLMASKLLGSKEKDLLKLVNPPKIKSLFAGDFRLQGNRASSDLKTTIAIFRGSTVLDGVPPTRLQLLRQERVLLTL